MGLEEDGDRNSMHVECNEDVDGLIGLWIKFEGGHVIIPSSPLDDESARGR